LLQGCSWRSSPAMGCRTSRSVDAFEVPAKSLDVPGPALSQPLYFNSDVSLSSPSHKATGGDVPEPAAEPESAASAERSALAEALRRELEEALAAGLALLELGDVPGTEAALAAALARIEASGAELGGARCRALVQQLRASHEYRSVLPLLRQMEAVAEEVLGGGKGSAEGGAGGGEWKLGAEVKMDFKSLGIPVDEHSVQNAEALRVLMSDGTSVKVYYRLNGRRLDIRMSTMLPTKTPSGFPSITGLAAMYHETTLWETWHPTMVGKGPTELRKRRPCHNLWHIVTKFLLQKYAEIQEERVYYVPTCGVYMMTMEGKAADSELWTQHPPPSGTKILPGSNCTKIVHITQEHTSVLGLMTTTVGAQALPEFIVKFIVSWMIPEVIRRMLRAGAESLKSGGPHWQAMQADDEGVYARCKELQTRAPEADKARGGTIFAPSKMPTPDVVKGRGGNLLVFEQAFGANAVPWLQVDPSERLLEASAQAAASGDDVDVAACSDEAELPPPIELDLIDYDRFESRNAVVIDSTSVLCGCGCGP